MLAPPRPRWSHSRQAPTGVPYATPSPRHTSKTTRTHTESKNKITFCYRQDPTPLTDYSVRVPRANASRHNDHPSPVLPSVTRGLAHEGITCVIGQSIRHGHPSVKKCFPGVGGGVPCCSTGGSLLSTGNLFVSRWRSGGNVSKRFGGGKGGQ